MRRPSVRALLWACLCLCTVPLSLLTLGQSTPDALSSRRCFTEAELTALRVAPTARPAALPPLRLERNMWQGHYLTTAAAAILLKEANGFATLIEDTDGATIYDQCGSEPQRMNFETWPLSLSSVRYEEMFTQQGLCVSSGPLGIIGRSGWFVPTQTAQNPATSALFLEFWRGYTNPAATALFPRAGSTPNNLKQGTGREFVPPWCVESTSPPGCSYSPYAEEWQTGACTVQYNPHCMELLAIDATYDEGLLAQQVRNNRLNFTIPYLSETHFYDAVLARTDAHLPVLFSYWEPSAFILSREFTRVSLKEWSAYCSRNNTASWLGEGSIDCDFGTQYLQKIVSAALVSNPLFSDAVHLATRFSLSNIDQTEMLQRMPLDRLDEWDGLAFDVACGWLKSNANRWTPWIVNTVEPPRHTLPVSDAARTAVLAVVCVMGACSLALHALLLVFRAHPLVVSSSVSFCQLIVAGSWFAYAAVLVLPYRSSAGVCTSFPILLCSGFTLIFASLFVKTWRLHSIFSTRALSVVRIRNSDLARLLGALALLDGVIFLAWNLSDKPGPVLRPSSADRHADIWECTSTHFPVWFGLLLAPKAALMAWGVYLAYKVRAVAANFNESRWIGICIYNASVLGCVMLPLLEVMDSQPSAHYLLLALGVLATVGVALGALFGPKFLRILDLGRTAPAPVGSVLSLSPSQQQGDGSDTSTMPPPTGGRKMPPVGAPPSALGAWAPVSGSKRLSMRTGSVLHGGAPGGIGIGTGNGTGGGGTPFSTSGVEMHAPTTRTTLTLPLPSRTPHAVYVVHHSRAVREDDAPRSPSSHGPEEQEDAPEPATAAAPGAETGK